MRVRALFAVAICVAGCAATPEQDTTPRPLTTAQIARLVLPKVVLVKTPGKFGTGFMVGTDGRIATNYHVLEGADRASIATADGNEYKRVSLLAVDREHDLAILRVESATFEGLPLAHGTPSPGDPVVVVGNPMGLTGTVSDGLGSAVRTPSLSNRQIQISAPISP